MPLLFDLRGNPAYAHYEDNRWRRLILGEMRQHFGPRWAIVTGTETEKRRGPSVAGRAAISS